jgi:hypothetical protein
MLHKFSTRIVSSTSQPANDPTKALHLAPPQKQPAAQSATPLLELVAITSRRCSSFFAEAAVLVLVFGILDYLMLKGRIEVPWILGALAISLALLGGSIVMDFTAHRWMKAHP